MTSEKEQVEAELNAKRAEEEKEKERIRQEEEAQKQKEEAERIRQEKEEKERPKKEAIENLTIFLDKTTKLITYINSITFTTLNKNKTNNEDPLYVINFHETNKIQGLDRNKITQQLHNEYKIINKLTILDRYVKALTFIKTSIEDDSINDLEYNQFNEDEDHDQYFQIMKDGSTTKFPHLRPKFIKELISTLNNICENKNYIEKVSEKCNIFRNEFYKGSNRIDENEQYIKLFETTMNSVRVYFKQIHGIESKIPKTITSFETPIKNKSNTKKKYTLPTLPEDSTTIISKNIDDAVNEVKEKLYNFINKFNSESKSGLLFYKNNNDINQLNKNVKNSYEVIQNFGKFCEGNFVLKPKEISGFYPKLLKKDKETATKLDIKLKYEKVTGEKNHGHNTRHQKQPCGEEFDKAIEEILIIFNNAFFEPKMSSVQSASALQTLPNNKTKLLQSQSESVLPNGGKKKTRRKGRTKKKTKTRKK